MSRCSTRPNRRNGEAFGFGPLCTSCFEKHYSVALRRRKKFELQNPGLREKRLAAQAERTAIRAERRAEQAMRASRMLQVIGCRCGSLKYRFAHACDLCGAATNGARFAGSEFDLEGKICRQCRDELRDERAANRLRELEATPYVSPIPATRGAPKSYLKVLTPGFTAEELTLQARCRLMVISAGNREARLSQPKPSEAQPKPAVPCADCGTTGGYVDKRFNSIIRCDGGRFGIGGRLCWACYRRHNKAHVLAQPLEMSA